MSTDSCTSPRPSALILPISSDTSSPSASFWSRNALPMRRTISPRFGAGSCRHDACALTARAMADS